jgi:hypothetical protein
MCGAGHGSHRGSTYQRFQDIKIETRSQLPPDVFYAYIFAGVTLHSIADGEDVEVAVDADGTCPHQIAKEGDLAIDRIQKVCVVICIAVYRHHQPMCGGVSMFEGYEWAPNTYVTWQSGGCSIPLRFKSAQVDATSLNSTRWTPRDALRALEKTRGGSAAAPLCRTRCTRAARAWESNPERHRGFAALPHQIWAKGTRFAHVKATRPGIAATPLCRTRCGKEARTCEKTWYGIAASPLRHLPGLPH